jgi:N,N-dimethylformamidase
MVPLVGYTDRFPAAPGQEIAFKVSSAAGGPYRATLVRVVHTDPNPEGPGMKYESTDTPAAACPRRRPWLLSSPGL